jgi:tetratricopeptide (TPR) repeat protein
MSNAEAERLFIKGLEVFDQDNTLSALSCFEKALDIEDSPIISSYFAFCIAKERGQISKAISLCKDAIEKEPKNSVHYLNLGRVYLLSDKREDAIKIFTEGLNCESNQKIIDELNRLGTRILPVISFLKRSSPLNKYLAIILKKLRIR